MISSTDLILNADGSVYHLCLLPSDIAQKIILVGDPERVSEITQHFDSVEITKQKREFHTQTGYFQNERITVISTGIGTDNIDIVLNELDALANIDLEKREAKETLTSLKIMRLGTCGGLQTEIEVGAIVYSRFAIGMDGLNDYYWWEDEEKKTEALEIALEDHLLEFPEGGLSMYIAEADADFPTLLENYPQIIQGITLTAKGFYAPQGRMLRLEPAFPNLLDRFASFHFGDYKVTNLEMETAGILGLGKALGHKCVSLSVVLANRNLKIFAQNPSDSVANLIQTGLALFVSWQ
jgi:uridine phosphorylase